jgi:hypothetical protein
MSGTRPTQRRVQRTLRWLGLVVLLALVASFGFEVVRGSDRPLATMARRGDAGLRHLGVLPRLSFGSYEKGMGGASFGTSDAASDAMLVTSEYVTTKEPMYALGFWPLGMQLSSRDTSYDGPLDFVGYRLVWWNGDERHVVDTADRANGRLPAGATSVEVRGWIPFEASRWGVETLPGGQAPLEWREGWSEGEDD